MYHVVVQYYERPRKERTPFVRSALNKGTSDRHTKDHNDRDFRRLAHRI